MGYLTPREHCEPWLRVFGCFGPRGHCEPSFFCFLTPGRCCEPSVEGFGGTVSQRLRDFGLLTPRARYFGFFEPPDGGVSSWLLDLGLFRFMSLLLVF